MIRFKGQEVTRKMFNAALEAFLAEQHAGGGRWSWSDQPIEDKDWDAFRDLLRMLAALKWEPDCDGHVPIEYSVLDITRYEHPGYIQPIPKVPFMNQRLDLELDALEIESANAKVAAEKVAQRAATIQRLRQDRAEKKFEEHLQGIATEDGGRPIPGWRMDDLRRILSYEPHFVRYDIREGDVELTIRQESYKPGVEPLPIPDTREGLLALFEAEDKRRKGGAQ